MIANCKFLEGRGPVLVIPELLVAFDMTGVP